MLKPILEVRALRALLIGAVVALALTGSATGQTGSSSGTQGRTEILFLGTAGGPPLRLGRSEPATLLVVDGRPYLIDCGIGSMQRMLQAHIASEDIKTIFFTHLHADHDLGVADVMENDFFKLNAASSTQKIEIYGPPQTKALVDAAFQYITGGFAAFAAEPGAIRAALENGEIKSPFVAHEIEGNGEVYRDDKIRVIAAENTHYALMPAQVRRQIKSYSYRFETPYGVLVFTGDTGASDAVISLAKGADVLVSEVEDLEEATRFVTATAEKNHWPPQRAAAMIEHFRQEHLDEKEVGEMATKAQVNSAVLYHYNPVNPAAEVARVKEYFSGPVFASADLERYCLGPTSGKSNDNSHVLTPCKHDQ